MEGLYYKLTNEPKGSGELKNNVSSTLTYDFFYLGFTAHQDYPYFTHFEPIQLLVGAKTGDPREKTPSTRKQNLACRT